MSGEALFAFSRGGSLGADVLKALARELFGPNVDYGPTIDRLRRLKREPLPLGITPPAAVGTRLPQRGPNSTATRPQPVQPQAAVTKALRPGWIE